MCQLKPLSTSEGSDRSNLAAVSAGCSSSVPFKPSLGRTILTGKRKHFEIASTVVAPIRVAPSAAAYTAAAFSSPSSKIAFPSTSPVSSPPRYSSEEEDGDAFDDGLGDFGQLEPAFKKQKVSEFVAVNRPKASSTSTSASASSANNNNNNNNNNKVSLVQAARSGDLKVVQELLEEYKQSGQLSQIINQQVVGCTALHYAVFYNRMDIVQVLVQYGAGLNIPNESELTPLAWAVDRGHTAIVRFLLQAGADPQLPDKQGATPLHRAILSGNAEITRSLLTCAALAKSGVAAAAAVASEDSESEDSDSELDEDEDDEDVCYSGYGVPKKMKKKGQVKKVPQTSSASSASSALPRLDVNAGTKDEGLTALHQAALHGRAELVELLVTLAGRTLDVNARTVRDATPLHKAACKNHAAVAECLLRHGARVDALDRTQRTALHWACFYGHSEVARVLLKYGANPDVEDKLHTSPLALAERKGFEEMVKLLEESKDLCATQ